PGRGPPAPPGAWPWLLHPPDRPTDPPPDTRASCGSRPAGPPMSLPSQSLLLYRLCLRGSGQPPILPAPGLRGTRAGLRRPGGQATLVSRGLPVCVASSLAQLQSVFAWYQRWGSTAAVVYRPAPCPRLDALAAERGWDLVDWAVFAGRLPEEARVAG